MFRFIWFLILTCASNLPFLDKLPLPLIDWAPKASKTVRVSLLILSEKECCFLWLGCGLSGLYTLASLCLSLMSAQWLVTVLPRQHKGKRVLWVLSSSEHTGYCAYAYASSISGKLWFRSFWAEQKAETQRQLCSRQAPFSDSTYQALSP